MAPYAKSICLLSISIESFIQAPPVIIENIPDVAPDYCKINNPDINNGQDTYLGVSSNKYLDGSLINDNNTMLRIYTEKDCELLKGKRDENNGAGYKGECIILNKKGELVCANPFPSMPLRFWNDKNNEKFENAYFNKFPNIWAHGDYIQKTKNNGYIIYGRSDATLKPGGVRIGTSEIYRQVETFDEILEALVIGQDYQDDVRIVLFVKLKAQINLDNDLINRIKNNIRKNCSPKHIPSLIIACPEIPKTKSGKIVELAVKNILDGNNIKNKEALANPEALKQFKNLKELSN